MAAYQKVIETRCKASGGSGSDRHPLPTARQPTAHICKKRVNHPAPSRGRIFWDTNCTCMSLIIMHPFETTMFTPLLRGGHRVIRGTERIGLKVGNSSACVRSLAGEGGGDKRGAETTVKLTASSCYLVFWQPPRRDPLSN